MATPPGQIRVRLDPGNPGQFFACCGLLELADRLWPGSEGWFDHSGFVVAAVARDEELPVNTATVLKAIAAATFTPLDPSDAGASPLELGAPFGLRLDWWQDGRSGGKRMKTWAGQQSVIDITDGMQTAVARYVSEAESLEVMLHAGMETDGLPFNFDSDLGGSAGAPLDVGFSFDPLKSIRVRSRPVTELLALIGLQRFRAHAPVRENRYLYALWRMPLSPGVAASSACTLLDSARSVSYEFRLLYRTKYLKSFLPAKPLGR